MLPIYCSVTKRFVFFFLVLVSMGISSVAQSRSTNIAESPPAFTEYVAGFLHDAMPSAKVTVIGPLRLDVETPNGGHTTNLDNVYSVCVRNPDNCIVEVTAFVAAAVELYKARDISRTRDALRIVVRPSALVAEVRAASRRNKPLATQLAGNYWVIAVFDAPTTIAVADEADLPPLKLTPNEALAVANSNTRSALRQSVLDELAKGPCRGMLGGDLYVASAFAFPDLWAAAAHRCHDNLLVAVPASDVVLYIDGTMHGALKSITHAADDVMAHDEKPFSDDVFRWAPTGWITEVPPVKSAK